jgi:hypothetical protein
MVLIPRVEFHDELPQWIISSDTGAYHPWSSTIFIRRGLGWRKLVITFLHEIGHHIICLLGLPEVFHKALDGATA